MAIGLKDLQDEALRTLLGTRCYTKAVAAIGSAAAKVKTTAAISYSINGIMYTKGATDDLWVLSGKTVPASSTCYFLLCLDATGASVVVQGTSTGHGEIPKTSGIPTACPIAELKVVTSAAGTFIPGTTELSAAQVTDTYTDLACIPVGGVAA